jgi:L-threonylcarbamoyladenylate synthase
MARIITDIAEAAQALQREDVIGFPTETVYGLAGDIYSAKAIARIFEIKKRPAFNPLIVHIGHIDQLKEITEDITQDFFSLAQTFWPADLAFGKKRQHLNTNHRWKRNGCGSHASTSNGP